MNIFKKRKFENRKKQLLSEVEKNPKDLDGHLILAKFYYLNECYQEAIEVYKKLMQYYPENASVLYNLAVAYVANGNINIAKNLYLHVLKIDPQNKEAQKGLEKLTTFK